MKILLVGENITGNIGDQVICSLLKRKMEVDLGINNIPLFSITRKRTLFDKIFLKIFGNGKLFQKYDAGIYQKMLESYKDYDAFVFCGGQLFMDYFQRHIQYIVRFCESNGIACMFNSIGIGKMTDAEKNAYEDLLSRNCVKFVSLRDNWDFFNINENVTFTYDTVLLLDNNYNSMKEGIAVGVMSPQSIWKNNPNFDAQRYREKLYDIMRVMKEQNIRCTLFTSGDYGDNKFLIDLKNSSTLLEDDDVFIPDTAEDLLRFLSNKKKVLSFRMHSLIFSIDSGAECYGVVWDNKVKFLFNALGMGNNIISLKEFIELDNFEFLTNNNITINNLKNIREHIEEKYREMLEKIKVECAQKISN